VVLRRELAQEFGGRAGDRFGRGEVVAAATDQRNRFGQADDVGLGGAGFVDQLSELVEVLLRRLGLPRAVVDRRDLHLPRRWRLRSREGGVSPLDAPLRRPAHAKHHARLLRLRRHFVDVTDRPPALRVGGRGGVGVLGFADFLAVLIEPQHVRHDVARRHLDLRVAVTSGEARVFRFGQGNDLFPSTVRDRRAAAFDDQTVLLAILRDGGTRSGLVADGDELPAVVSRFARVRRHRHGRPKYQPADHQKPRHERAPAAERGHRSTHTERHLASED
jgi:hypothetical protein